MPKLSCPQCPKSFRTESGLAWHSQHVHHLKPGSITPEQRLEMRPAQTGITLVELDRALKEAGDEIYWDSEVGKAFLRALVRLHFMERFPSGEELSGSTSLSVDVETGNPILALVRQAGQEYPKEEQKNIALECLSCHSVYNTIGGLEKAWWGKALGIHCAACGHWGVKIT